MAIRFPTVNDYLKITAGLPATSAWTWMGWYAVFSGSGVGSDNFFSRGSSGATPPAGRFNLYLRAAATPTESLSVGTNTFVNSGTTPPPLDGTWFPVGVVKNGAAVQIYYKGLPDLLGTLDVTAPVEDILLISVGVDLEAPSVGQHLDCATAAHKLWEAALTDDEMRKEMASFSPIRSANLYGRWPLTGASDLNDVSGNAHHWTAVGTPTTVDGPTTRGTPGP